MRIYFKTIIFGKDFIIDATTTLNIRLRQNTHKFNLYSAVAFDRLHIVLVGYHAVSSSSGGANLKILGKGCR